MVCWRPPFANTLFDGGDAWNVMPSASKENSVEFSAHQGADSGWQQCFQSHNKKDCTVENIPIKWLSSSVECEV